MGQSCCRNPMDESNRLEREMEEEPKALGSKLAIKRVEPRTERDDLKEELRQQKELQYRQQKLGGARNMQIMGHQVVGNMDKSHEDVKMMFEKFFSGDAVSIRRALRNQIASLQTRKLLSQMFQVIYDYVQRKVVERLARKALQLDQQPQSQSSREKKAEQFAPLFKHTELFTSCRDDQVAFRANMIEKQREYGILLHNCDLMEMTDAKVEEETKKMKEKFHGRNIPAEQRFEDVKDFIHTNSIEQEFDIYIKSSVRLALLMVTRIPPMIAVEPTTFDPRCTIQDASWNESDVETQQITSMQPIVYFSYEGEVAVRGIVTNTPDTAVAKETPSGITNDTLDSRDQDDATAVVKKTPSEITNDTPDSRDQDDATANTIGAGLYT